MLRRRDVAMSNLPGAVSAAVWCVVAILGIASIGQHLVIQQRGLDLSVAGIMSFSAVIVSALPSTEAGVAGTLRDIGGRAGRGVEHQPANISA